MTIHKASRSVHIISQDEESALKLRRNPRNKRVRVLTRIVRGEPFEGVYENSNYEMGVDDFRNIFWDRSDN